MCGGTVGMRTVKSAIIHTLTIQEETKKDAWRHFRWMPGQEEAGTVILVVAANAETAIR